MTTAKEVKQVFDDIKAMLDGIDTPFNCLGYLVERVQVSLHGSVEELNKYTDLQELEDIIAKCEQMSKLDGCGITDKRMACDIKLEIEKVWPRCHSHPAGVVKVNAAARMMLEDEKEAR